MAQHPPFPTMPFMQPFAPLLELFRGLPRRGPGSEASTLRALVQCGLPAHPSVADLGCGSGASTLVLARELQVPIFALDADGLALDTLWESARAQGLLHLLALRSGDMADPGLPPASLDLLWSEGAITHLGWKKGLPLWFDLLKPGGFLAFTDATWLVDDPPKEARDAWAGWYPEMDTCEARLRFAREQGLEVVDTFALPSEDWWTYLDLAESRCRALAERPDLATCIDGLRAEMALYRACGHSYGYVFYILRRRGGGAQALGSER